MALTNHVAQSFRREGSRLAPETRKTFATSQEAVSAAQEWAPSKAGAVAYSTTGDSADSMDELHVWFRSGELPENLQNR